MPTSMPTSPADFVLLFVMSAQRHILDITNGKDYGVVEVPSWAWNRKLPEVQDYPSRYVDGIDPYVWPFLRDNLAFCHCLFSRTAVAITPIYMSATIADDNEIVRTFGASPEAVAKPSHRRRWPASASG